MPPKRKSAGPRTASFGQQSRISFHGKQNKVTKPASRQHAKDSKKDPAAVEGIAPSNIKAEAEPDLDEPTTAEKAIQQQVRDEGATLTSVPDPLETDRDAITTDYVLGGRAEESDVGATGGKGSGWVGDEEEQARKVSDVQIKRYWRQKEQERLAPRVHQEDLSVYEKVLREWDMSGQYGPCIGIARLKRWKRANMLGLKPPVEVLAVLLKEMDSGEAKSQRAYVDELMSSRFVET